MTDAKENQAPGPCRLELAVAPSTRAALGDVSNRPPPSQTTPVALPMGGHRSEALVNRMQANLHADWQRWRRTPYSHLQDFSYEEVLEFAYRELAALEEAGERTMVATAFESTRDMPLAENLAYYAAKGRNVSPSSLACRQLAVLFRVAIIRRSRSPRTCAGPRACCCFSTAVCRLCTSRLP